MKKRQIKLLKSRNNYTNNKKTVLFATQLFILIPYHLVDLYQKTPQLDYAYF